MNTKKHLCPTCVHAIFSKHYTFNEETCIMESHNPTWHCDKDGKPRENVTECENYEKRKSSAICKYC